MAMLDQYAGHHNQLKRTRNTYQNWRQADNHLKQLQENSAANLAQKQLLEGLEKQKAELKHHMSKNHLRLREFDKAEHKVCRSLDVWCMFVTSFFCMHMFENLRLALTQGTQT